MFQEEVTYDVILDFFKDSVKNKRPLRALDWNDAAFKLNLLAEDIDDKLAEFEFTMLEEESRLLLDGNTAASAKRLKAQAIDYKDFLMLKAKRARIDEFIRLSKKRAELELRSATIQ